MRPFIHSQLLERQPVREPLSQGRAIALAVFAGIAVPAILAIVYFEFLPLGARALDYLRSL